MRTHFLLLGVAALLLAGCWKPEGGPETPDKAGQIMTEQAKIDPSAAPPPETPEKIEQANRAYWEAYCKQFGYGDNLRLDGRLVLPDLPSEDVRDPLLIDIHNTTADILKQMGTQLDQAAQGRETQHPGALQNEAIRLLKPKLEKAGVKYGVPEAMKDSPLIQDTAPPPGP